MRPGTKWKRRTRAERKARAFAAWWRRRPVILDFGLTGGWSVPGAEPWERHRLVEVDGAHRVVLDAEATAAARLAYGLTP